VGQSDDVTQNGSSRQTSVASTSTSAAEATAVAAVAATARSKLARLQNRRRKGDQTKKQGLNVAGL